MKQLRRKWFGKTALAIALLALGSGSVQASPLVTTWTVTNNATFVPSTVVPDNGVFPFPVLTGGNTELSWGDATNQSGLTIINSGLSVPVNTGELTSTVLIRHDNFPIPAATPSNSLSSVDILAKLTLQSFLPSAGSTVTGEIVFGVQFLETPNNGIDGFCADGAAVGSGGININGCSDIFVISSAALNFFLPYDSDGGDDDPEPYFVSFFADGFNTLSDAACQSAGAAVGCRGFQTIENQSTTADFKILISSTPFETPEPGSISLVGLAMAALGWMGRRRKLV